jgi:hypothetical protein
LVRHTLTLIVAALVFASPVGAAVLKIVAIGAGNTYGWGVGSQNAYPAQLQALLRGKGLHANVINAGVLGDTTAGMLRRLDTAVPKGANIVILQPGGNDLRFGFSKEQRAANIGAMVTLLPLKPRSPGPGLFIAVHDAVIGVLSELGQRAMELRTAISVGSPRNKFTISWKIDHERREV